MCERCLEKFHDEPIRRVWVGPPMIVDNATGGPIPAPAYTGAPSDLRWDPAVKYSARAAIDWGNR